ncbi:PTS lactose/cellobiose transporter subunit IIA [Cellulomonas soli]|uniref:Lichenan-specific phosphotransferase enzyme IIA component n=1 Tax=Cellulomonas soli TaxID=931535 RepID=A0A512PDA7_9CELL|nr:PTS lactose/cellobiose transporter subunit IIA [Cellulomonas soli]NYI60234.1 PTS system cellobiose-specific IIA component [Cellulomonas soli]GEP69112.1 lichenan-specific phosphotransferase enzyme IIA component [Cellulomonas soli]
MDEEYAIAFELISQAGDARSSAMLALRAARQGDLPEAWRLLAAAESSLGAAHQRQTELVQSEARGERVPVNIILVHAQDHLTSAMTVRDLAEELVHVYERLGVPVATSAD